MSLSNPVYDGSGNPTAFSSPATTPIGATATAYDGASFSFDFENRLAGISSSSPSVSFSALYDGDGMRTSKTVNGTTTYYLYDGDQLLEEQVERGGMAALQSMYLVGADGLRARFATDTSGDLYTYVYSYDPEGSLCQLQLTKNYSALVRYAENTFCYDAWGQLLGDIKVSTGAAQVPSDTLNQSE